MVVTYTWVLGTHNQHDNTISCDNTTVLLAYTTYGRLNISFDFEYWLDLVGTFVFNIFQNNKGKLPKQLNTPITNLALQHAQANKIMANAAGAAAPAPADTATAAPIRINIALEINSLRTRLALAASDSIPTELRIFSISSLDGSFPPREANRYINHQYNIRRKMMGLKACCYKAMSPDIRLMYFCSKLPISDQ
ncbi:hypothetical protein AGLY_002724 [Aphis glycines]|uniref:Uncharacterized protein n=1 Tax=Aphis glycines TaxID=307491 RepID=A0A6G0U1J8_APHGL|nr:hypothetical protein AGLY_002724 [Aphis glycines]